MERVHHVFRPTETPEFLCRLSACEALMPQSPNQEIFAAESSTTRNPLSFPSSDTCMLLMDRILSQSRDVSPRTSGRLSHRSSPLNGSFSDSPPLSPSGIHQPKRPLNIPTGAHYKGSVTGANRTVGRWLKDRKEKKKEELRALNAQIHAAVSVAGVASAIAAIAAATAASSGSEKDERATRTDLAVASAATLVAAQCVEAAEAMGAERDHLTSVVSSAVNVHSAGDIMTLTAAAATALRAAATLKARSVKDISNNAAVIPVEKGNAVSSNSSNASFSGELVPDQNFPDRDLLARGFELLKRTRKGDLHWKMVSVYINKEGKVMLKMKSKHIAGTVTKKKKNVVLELVKSIPPWPHRNLVMDGDEFAYFGLKMESGRVIEFECRNRREYEVWTQGVERLLEIAGHKSKGNK